MEELFAQFINEKKFLSNLSQGTLHYYREVYEFFKVEGFDGSKQSLQAAVIRMRERGTSTGAVNTYIRGMNVFLNWLEKEHSYPHLSLKKLRTEQRIFKSLTDPELRAIISYKPKTFCKRRVHALSLLLLDTGMRVNEGLTLEKSKVDFDNLLMSIRGKGNKDRIVPFSYEVRKVLFKYSHSHKHELVFCTGHGTKILYANALRNFYDMEKDLGIKTDGAFHSLRRTFATNFIRQGGNPLVLQRLLGHSTLTQTSQYVKLVTDDLQGEQHRTSLLNRLR
jgi:integrase/recombinase XerD